MDNNEQKPKRKKNMWHNKHIRGMTLPQINERIKVIEFRLTLPDKRSKAKTAEMKATIRALKMAQARRLKALGGTDG